MTSAPVLGIDFGTTNSVCAVQLGDETEVLPNDNGSNLTPSVVYYTKDDERNRPLIGEQAENKARQNPERVVRSIKRSMGESETIRIGGDSYNVPEVASEILRKIRTDAADALNVDRDVLTDVVITRPAYWEEDRTNAIHQAAEMAGFTSVRLIKEPAAAAIAYGQYRPDTEKTIGVYDLGGGTFDFAVVDVDIENKSSSIGREEYSVVAQSGDPQLGGDDWDDKIVSWVRNGFETEYDVDPFEPHPSDDNEFEHLVRRERVREQARAAKEKLSDVSVTEATINIPFFMDVHGETVSIDRTLSESKFRSMTQELAERTIDPMYTALDDAGLTKAHLDDVILVGGSTKMPQVQELIHAELEVEPTHDVNPSEAVSVGASVHGNRDDILLLEVTPLSLGIGIKGDRFKRMVERNTRLPAKRTEVFTPSRDGQTAVRIPVYQGEREIASENRHLKTLILDGLTPGRKQSAQVKVTFEVQKNGIINVRAVESTDNRSVSVEIEGENRLSDEFVDEKVQEAREMEELDRRRQRVIEAQNEAEDAIKDAEQVMERYPHVIDESEKREIQNHVSNVKSIRSDNTATVGDLQEATHDLNEWVLKIGDRARQEGVTAQRGPENAPEVQSRDFEAETTSVEAKDKPASPDDISTSEQWDDEEVSTESFGEANDSDSAGAGMGPSTEGYIEDGEEEQSEEKEEDDGDDGVDVSGSGSSEGTTTGQHTLALPEEDSNGGEEGEFGVFDDETEGSDEDDEDSGESTQAAAWDMSGGDEEDEDEHEPQGEGVEGESTDEDGSTDSEKSDETDSDSDEDGSGRYRRIDPEEETEQGTLADDDAGDDSSHSESASVVVADDNDGEEGTKQAALESDFIEEDEGE